MTVAEVAIAIARRPGEETVAEAPLTHGRRLRAGGGVPATRHLERTLGGVITLAVAAATAGAIVPIASLSAIALALAAALFAVALVMGRAIATLMPPIPRTVRGGTRKPLRVAVVGSGSTAANLSEELRQGAVECVSVVGAIVPAWRPGRPHDPCELGALADVRQIVEVHAIDVLLMADGESRPQVVDAVLRSCEGDPVRLCDLAAFYSGVFGRLPVGQADRASLQFLLHPRYRERRAQRTFDLVVGGVLAAAFLPLLGPLALLVRLDGGPAFFRQERIGRDGRRFVVSKLRTMRLEGEQTPQRWSRAGDSRVTPIGRVLRRSHLDELPQLFSVLRGDMSIVGPRPEQPEIAAGLEAVLPHWRGRYRYRPGLTGWAQVSCGYAGSTDGSAWKLAHDLYYLRHQSLALDTAILVQTAYTLLFTPQFVENAPSAFVAHCEPERGWDGASEPAIAMPPEAA